MVTLKIRLGSSHIGFVSSPVSVSQTGGLLRCKDSMYGSREESFGVMRVKLATATRAMLPCHFGRVVNQESLSLWLS